MARQILVLDQDASHADAVRFQAAFWLVVPAARQFRYVNASAKSALLDGSVTAGELTALQNGSVLEVVQSFGYPNGTGLAAIEADLQVQYTATQAALTNQTGPFAATKMTHYGSSFDGTTWTITNLS